MALALGAVYACKAYDASLLPDQAARAGTGAAAGRGVAGSAANGGGGAAGESEPSPGGGVQNRCGDGQVDAAEKCDTGIADGAPGACPRECGSEGACQRVQLVNRGCESECRVLELDCKGGD